MSRPHVFFGLGLCAVFGCAADSDPDRVVFEGSKSEKLPGGVEAVRRRVLIDQLGQQVAKSLGLVEGDEVATGWARRKPSTRPSRDAED